jgi:rubrerythrin
MFDNIDEQEAIKRSIQTEKNAMNFYRRAAASLKNPESKRVFEVLAREEKEHAKEFWDISGSGDAQLFEAFMAEPSPATSSDWLNDLEKILLPDFNERQAMSLAMEKELKLEKSLRDMAAKISNPKVRQVFEANAKSTHHHYLLIESEYARLMGMVHETDMDTFVRE